MKSQRHPHRHVDPRQPRNGSRPGTNPPVFAWKPPADGCLFDLTVARDVNLKDTVFSENGLTEPVYLPTRALSPGKYYWKWFSGDAEGELFEFEVTPESVVLEVPQVEDWLEHLPQGHPRIWINPDQVEELRSSRNDSRAQMWNELRAKADVLIDEVHEIEEPPFLGDRDADYEGWFASWLHTLNVSRKFMRDALTMAQAFVASGDVKYARPACRRLASISEWDPMGSSHIDHNDEAHMSVIWDGPQIADFVWEHFTEEERKLVLEQFRRRGEINFEHMHGRGSYGVTRFDSHAGREIVFLAQLALVFHQDIPAARKWLEWLRPVLCGIWPVWGVDDGSWAEGLSYGLAYVRIMTFFASALKHGAGVDLYKRPFWKGHADWRRWCFPHYLEWLGFGDHSERWSGTLYGNAALVEIIARETGTHEFDDYIRSLRSEAEDRRRDTPVERQGSGITDPQLYFADPSPQIHEPPPQDCLLQVFPDAGWAALRTDLTSPEEDIAFIFRSSPYGAYSHSHANNNDFIIHVGGKVMAMPSGYYDGYGSNHHTHWNWHTKSHNCLTLSGAGQLMRSCNSSGSIQNDFEDENLAFMTGNADASYSHVAKRCRRHVVFLKKSGCFLLVDELVNQDEVNLAMEWNIHSWAQFQVDEDNRSFHLERDGSRLDGHFLYHHNAFFTLTEGWQPPPKSAKSSDQWHDQYHLCFTPAGLVTRRNLGVILASSGSKISSAAVSTQRIDNTESARVGDDLVLIDQGSGIDAEGITSDAVAAVRVGGRLYEIGDWGIRIR